MTDERATEQNPGVEPVTTGTEESFPAAYVRELRAENARRRANERKLETELQGLKTTLGTGESETDLSAKVQGLMEETRRTRALAEETLVVKEFEKESRERGVVDPDAAWRLMDRDALTVDLEKREVQGLAEAMESLLAQRPYLAGKSVGRGSVGGGTPRTNRSGTDDSLAGRVRKQFQRRNPGGLSVSGGSTGTMRIR